MVHKVKYTPFKIALFSCCLYSNPPRPSPKVNLYRNHLQALSAELLLGLRDVDVCWLCRGRRSQAALLPALAAKAAAASAQLDRYYFRAMLGEG